MMDKPQRKISNPLTVIAIFAGLAEVASTVAIAAVDTSIQGVFVWFVMLFPVLLVLLFFATLNFNPHVLYAPSDFKEEQNFLDALRKGRKLDKSFSELTERLEASTSELTEQLTKLSGTENAAEADQLRDLISQRFEEIRESVLKAQETAENVSAPLLPRSEFQARLVEFLYNADEGKTLDELASVLGREPDVTRRALSKLVKRGIVAHRDGKYRLSDL
jgi:hypothetical protein